MRHLNVLRLLLCVLIAPPIVASAQSTQDQSVPRLITITGIYRPADGKAPGAVETVTLSIYADEQGGAPLFQETQQVMLDDRGRYSVVLGAAHADGIPPSIFVAGGQWLGTVFERTGEVEGARVRLTSVPYAMRAAEADTLGGHPASDYVLANGNGSDGKAAATTSARSDVAGPAGTVNFLPKFVDTVNLGDSALYESGGMVGLGTTTPFDVFHVRYTNTGGNLTGLAVQNLGNTATSYSGMLFYDQNNQLGQFQGFNNVTHEYRINNIAKNGASQFNGSINFMTGSVSRFFVGSNGNIGIGTTAPSTNLEISNALTGTAVTDVNLTSFGSNSFGSLIAGRKARGTAAAPTAVQSGDSLAIFGGRGYGTTGFSSLASGLTISAAENWTDTAQGTNLNFATTPTGTTNLLPRMTINSFGNVGIGTFGPSSTLEASNALTNGPAAQVTTTTFTNAGSSLFVVSRARGTSGAPLAVQSGDNLGGFLGRGFFAGATSGFSGTRGGMFVAASENWTDTAQGTSLHFNTTANGTITPTPRVTITPSGDVGIGTTTPSGTVGAVRDGDVASFSATSFSSDGCCAGFSGQMARGTAAAPVAVQLGDPLALFLGDGYGTTHFSDEGGGMIVLAAENFSDTAQGTAVAFTTTPLGSTEDEAHMAILPDGNVGIGTFDSFPTITDKLQVFGDIRIGTSGTNGCIKNFAGTGILGTCSSDRRLKKNITPFAPMLDKVTALQPVHYFWRSDEFPNRHFGDSQNYGLIAQDVEQVLPELVATDSDGYKAVDYSQLPLLTIQAMKELKAENDALKQQVAHLKEQLENDPLKHRVAELERLITEMFTRQK